VTGSLFLIFRRVYTNLTETKSPRSPQPEYEVDFTSHEFIVDHIGLSVVYHCMLVFLVALDNRPRSKKTLITQSITWIGIGKRPKIKPKLTNTSTFGKGPNRREEFELHTCVTETDSMAVFISCTSRFVGWRGSTTNLDACLTGLLPWGRATAHVTTREGAVTGSVDKATTRESLGLTTLQPGNPGQTHLHKSRVSDS
jgi:hypothetical protein